MKRYSLIYVEGHTHREEAWSFGHNGLDEAETIYEELIEGHMNLYNQGKLPNGFGLLLIDNENNQVLRQYVKC